MVGAYALTICGSAMCVSVSERSLWIEIDVHCRIRSQFRPNSFIPRTRISELCKHMVYQYSKERCECKTERCIHKNILPSSSRSHI